MKKILLNLVVLAIVASGLQAQSLQWKPAGNRISTKWSASVDPLKPLPEYPRPQMVRGMWMNLNGLWDYTVTGTKDSIPVKFRGKILVPFAIESSLSGVGRSVGPDSLLWYSTKFTVLSSMKGKTILLHFDGVDWESHIYINGIKAGSHSGGYDPFTVDITKYLTKSGLQQVDLKVYDPVDKGPQPRGKQVLKPSGIWYTSVTGIWRTVWIEAVPQTYIGSFTQCPDINKQELNLTIKVENIQSGDIVHASAFDNGKLVSEKNGEAGTPFKLAVTSPRLWSPEAPFLYDLTISVLRNGKIVDEVKSYFAMRKISLKADENGILRLALNDKFVFQYGPLDQGWWPDGLYTAPTDEALLYDIIKTKEMGFNTIRKHVKVEPARWYYHCDRTGMLVWQDMPSGDLGGGEWIDRPGLEGDPDKIRSEASEKIYRTEWNAIIDYLYNFPCVILWVPFNEGWGQFKSAEITSWTIRKDPSRLVNSASGGNFHEVGHVLDLHNYPRPVMPKPEIFGQRQALVLGEFGGLGLPLENHTWLDRNNWGYRTFKDADTLFKTYSGYLDQLVPFIKRGLSAAIYTQTTDVEIETNGLMTYDRKVIKIPEKQLSAKSDMLYETAKTVKLKP